MASTIGAWSYVKNDGSLSTKDDVNTNISSTGKNNSSGNKTTLDVNEFLKLMVAEMQNQDPLEPTDNSDYMAQLATFTQVEATKEMNTNTLQGMASDLVGKQVIMTTNQNSDGFIGGTVDYWESINGTVYLGIGGKLYDIADLDTVMDKSYYDKWSGKIDTKTDADSKNIPELHVEADPDHYRLKISAERFEYEGIAVRLNTSSTNDGILKKSSKMLLTGV